MITVNSQGMSFGVIFNSLSFGFFITTWESSGVMGNIKSSVTGPFKGTKDSGTGGGSCETNIKKGFEWSFIQIDYLTSSDVISASGVIFASFDVTTFV